MKKTSKAEFEAIADFVWWKNELVNSKFIPSIHELNALISMAKELDLPASKAQLIRYLDNYYPKEEE